MIFTAKALGGAWQRSAIMVLVLVFSLPLVTVTRDHCDGAAGCPTLMADQGNDVDASPEQARRHSASPELHNGQEGPGVSCVGLGCLCHQPRLLAGSLASPIMESSALTWPEPPARLELGVPREILHIPKIA